MLNIFKYQQKLNQFTEKLNMTIQVVDTYLSIHYLQ